MARRGDPLGATGSHGAVMQYVRILTVLSTRHACNSGPAGVSSARYAASNEAVSSISGLKGQLLYGPRRPTDCSQRSMHGSETYATHLQCHTMTSLAWVMFDRGWSRDGARITQGRRRPSAKPRRCDQECHTW